MSINKYQKLFEDEAGYKEIPFPVKIEILKLLIEFICTSGKDDAHEAISGYQQLDLHDGGFFPRLANFDLNKTEIYELAEQLEAIETEAVKKKKRIDEKVRRKKREFWEYSEKHWNIPMDNVRYYIEALRNFESAYGEKADPLKQMTSEELLDKFSGKYTVALINFQKAYGKTAYPLKHMNVDEFLDAFGKEEHDVDYDVGYDDWDWDEEDDDYADKDDED